ncbi:MAG TPA: hypothetical protein VGO59_16430 [Verrucomicrobiae bacterium]
MDGPIQKSGGRNLSAPPAMRAGSRPLMGMATAAFYLNFRKERVENQVNLGRLPAFNIARTEADRACLRLFSPAVLVFLSLPQPQRAARTAEMLPVILPGLYIHFSQARVAWLLHCDVGHIVGLCEAGDLAESGPRSPNGSRHISRTSLAKFLTERRVCV